MIIHAQIIPLIDPLRNRHIEIISSDHSHLAPKLSAQVFGGADLNELRDYQALLTNLDTQTYMLLSRSTSSQAALPRSDDFTPPVVDMRRNLVRFGSVVGSGLGSAAIFIFLFTLPPPIAVPISLAIMGLTGGANAVWDRGSPKRRAKQAFRRNDLDMLRSLLHQSSLPLETFCAALYEHAYMNRQTTAAQLLEALIKSREHSMRLSALLVICALKARNALPAAPAFDFVPAASRLLPQKYDPKRAREHGALIIAASAGFIRAEQAGTMTEDEKTAFTTALIHACDIRYGSPAAAAARQAVISGNDRFAALSTFRQKMFSQLASLKPVDVKPLSACASSVVRDMPADFRSSRPGPETLISMVALAGPEYPPQLRLAALESLAHAPMPLDNGNLDAFSSAASAVLNGILSDASPQTRDLRLASLPLATVLVHSQPGSTPDQIKRLLDLIFERAQHAVVPREKAAMIEALVECGLIGTVPFPFEKQKYFLSSLYAQEALDPSLRTAADRMTHAMAMHMINTEALTGNQTDSPVQFILFFIERAIDPGYPASLREDILVNMFGIAQRIYLDPSLFSTAQELFLAPGTSPQLRQICLLYIRQCFQYDWFMRSDRTAVILRGFANAILHEQYGETTRISVAETLRLVPADNVQYIIPHILPLMLHPGAPQKARKALQDLIVSRYANLSYRGDIDPLVISIFSQCSTAFAARAEHPETAAEAEAFLIRHLISETTLFSNYIFGDSCPRDIRERALSELAKEIHEGPLLRVQTEEILKAMALWIIRLLQNRYREGGTVLDYSINQHHETIRWICELAKKTDSPSVRTCAEDALISIVTPDYLSMLVDPNNEIAQFNFSALKTIMKTAFGSDRRAVVLWGLRVFFQACDTYTTLTSRQDMPNDYLGTFYDYAKTAEALLEEKTLLPRVRDASFIALTRKKLEQAKDLAYRIGNLKKNYSLVQLIDFQKSLRALLQEITTLSHDTYPYAPASATDEITISA